MFLTLLTFLSALSISCVSAYYSITGLTEIFPALVIPVIILGIVLEIGKLVAVSNLHQHWTTLPKIIKTYLITAVMILMLVNSMGIFGLLSKGHIEQEIINSNQMSNIELTLSRIQTEKDKIKDIDKQIAQIDDALTKMTSQGKAQTVLIQINAQKKNRQALVIQKTSESIILDNLNKERIDKEQSNKKIAASFGPLKYLTDIFYSNPNSDNLESVVRWIIITIVFVTDPLALILLVASIFNLKNRKDNLTGINESAILNIDNFE